MAIAAIRNPQSAIRNWIVRDPSSPVPVWGWVLAALLAVVAGVAPPLATIALIVVLVAGTLLLKNPLLGAFAVILSVPVQDTVTLPGGITITQVVFVLVLGLWWAWMSLRQDRRLVLTPIAVALFFFLASSPAQPVEHRLACRQPGRVIPLARDYLLLHHRYQLGANAPRDELADSGDARITGCRRRCWAWCSLTDSLARPASTWQACSLALTARSARPTLSRATST